jgi:hypothetical protein
MSKYGEDIGSEEIRRHLSKMLSDLQRRELDAVFSNWSGEDLLQAINATFDLDEPEVTEDDLLSLQAEMNKQLSKAVQSMGDKTLDSILNAEPVKKPRGRPRKAK